jgi:hypothetical protein
MVDTLPGMVIRNQIFMAHRSLRCKGRAKHAVVGVDTAADSPALALHSLGIQRPHGMLRQCWRPAWTSFSSSRAREQEGVQPGKGWAAREAEEAGMCLPAFHSVSVKGHKNAAHSWLHFGRTRPVRLHWCPLSGHVVWANSHGALSAIYYIHHYHCYNSCIMYCGVLAIVRYLFYNVSC